MMCMYNLLLTLIVIPYHVWDSVLRPFVFLYIGPETVMPLASILAAIVGLLLIFWRKVVGFFKKVVKLIVSRSAGASASDPVYTDPRDESESGVQG